MAREREILEVAQFRDVHEPKYDNTGWTPDYPDPAAYTAEIQPYSGFTESSFCYCTIRGRNLAIEPGAMLIMLLYIRQGITSYIGQWEQIAAETNPYNNSANINGPIRPGLGSWTPFAIADAGDGYAKVVAFYKEPTDFESQASVRWRIPVGPQVYSQANVRAIPPGCWRRPFVDNVKIAARATPPTMAEYRVPGIVTPVKTDVDASLYNFIGGTAILSASTMVGQFDNVHAPGGGLYAQPGRFANEQYGTIFHFRYGAPYAWGWTAAWTTGMPNDGRVIPDGEPNQQAPGAYPLGWASLTMAVSSPPNKFIPQAANSARTITNLFETNNLSTFFNVSGKGTPTIS